MTNDPMPWQLTVSELKKVLENAQDGAVVGLRIPAGFCAHQELATFVNLRIAEPTNGSVFSFNIAQVS